MYVYTALLTRGGVDRVLTVKANYLAERLGHEVWVVTDSQCGRPLAFPLSPKVRHVDLGTDFDAQYHHGAIMRYVIYRRLMRRYRRRLQRLLLDVRPDIVCSTLGRDMDFLTSLPDGSAKVGESHIAKPYTRNFHLLEARGWPYSIVARLWRRRQERAVARLDALVVLTQRDAQSWAPVRPATVIANPVTIDVGPPARVEASATVVAVGRLSEQKALDRLVRAWAAVAARHPDWQLQLWGEGEGRGALQDLIARLGLDASCRLMGTTADIASVYASAAIYAMSSRFEGFPLVLVEAMACGLPVVAMDCPTGPAEIIDSGRNGILVPDGDEAALADAICRLIEDPALRTALARQARADALGRYGIDATMQRWEALFASLRPGTPAPGRHQSSQTTSGSTAAAAPRP